MLIAEKEVFVSNKLGLHGRASAKLVETARRFTSDIRLVRDSNEVDCKSILDVMTMACIKGTPVTIKVRGVDADEALEALTALIDRKFDEE